MVRTRVGYAGGTTPNPTYHNLGNHSETIQIDYDPNMISYEDLLDIYWRSHRATSRPWSRQYMSVIFYHDNEQEMAAIEAREKEQKKRGHRIFTEILPFSHFFVAEDYHQKYRLQNLPQLAKEYRDIYPKMEDFLGSTAVARVNGYLGGYGNCDSLARELDDYGLSPAAGKRLVRLACARNGKKQPAQTQLKI